MYIIINKKISLQKRKKLFCAVIITLTSLITFGNWNLNYCGILFIVPIVISSPLDKSLYKKVFIICIILEVLYSIMQYYLTLDVYYYLLGVVSLTVLLAFYFIGKGIYKVMYNALLDVKLYRYESKSLHNEISHDFLTNTYSVSALHKDISENKNYTSLVFIDIDNFKIIKDNHGHSIGYSILKLIVSIVNDENESIYRYSGDEFVILCHLNEDKLAEKLEKLKILFQQNL